MRIRCVALVAVIMVIAGTAFAQGPPGHAGMAPPDDPLRAEGGSGPGGGRVARLTELLGLTEEQQAAWERLRGDAETAAAPLAAQARALHEEVRHALEAGGADATTIGARVIAAYDLETAMRAIRTAAAAAFRELLTAEQAAALDAVEADRELMRASRPRGGPPLP